jgi:hypothetical protein
MLHEVAEKPGIISHNNLTTGVTAVQYVQMCQLLHSLPNSTMAFGSLLWQFLMESAVNAFVLYVLYKNCS